MFLIAFKSTKMGQLDLFLSLAYWVTLLCLLVVVVPQTSPGL